MGSKLELEQPLMQFPVPYIFCNFALILAVTDVQPSPKQQLRLIRYFRWKLIITRLPLRFLDALTTVSKYVFEQQLPRQPIPTFLRFRIVPFSERGLLNI
jgi:hypothetical protein